MLVGQLVSYFQSNRNETVTVRMCYEGQEARQLKGETQVA